MPWLGETGAAERGCEAGLYWLPFSSVGDTGRAAATHISEALELRPKAVVTYLTVNHERCWVPRFQWFDPHSTTTPSAGLRPQPSARGPEKRGNDVQCLITLGVERQFIHSSSEGNEGLY